MENMSKTDIQNQLLTDCRAFIDIANERSEAQFTQQVDGKWSVAEVMQHLYLSARPVARLMAGPREVFDQWGNADRPSRHYEEIAAAYQKVLTFGNKAPASMSPRPEDMEVTKQGMIDRFSAIYASLVEASEGWSDNDLNTFLIPHPVLGMLTVREMLYFTSTHTQHHLRLLPKT